MGVFHFKHFDIDDHGCGMKICSDSVLLAAWFLPSYREARTVADVGAGSGILAMMAADIMPDAIITAIEKDTAAAEAASRNFTASPWADRLTTVNADFVDFAAEGNHKFNLVISNPPYFTTGAQATDAARAAARHQDTLSYDTILTANILEPGGHIGLVSPAEFEHDIIYRAELSRLKLRRLCRVVTSPSKQPTRLLWDFATDDGPLTDTTLAMRDTDGRYSPDYRQIVEPFYMKL